MSRLIDISVRLTPDTTTWPDSVGIRLTRTRSFALGDDVTVTRLDMDVHCGTHVEAPLHFINGGEPLEAYPLERFVGTAHVAELPGTGAIRRAELEAAAIPPGTERLLLRTSNSEFWQDEGSPFRSDFAALSVDAAEWVVEHGVRLIGADYLSIAPFESGPETHRVLMRGGVAILEGLNLREVRAGAYRLICLPLWLGDAEAAPARAALEILP